MIGLRLGFIKLRATRRSHGVPTQAGRVCKRARGASVRVAASPWAWITASRCGRGSEPVCQPLGTLGASRWAEGATKLAAGHIPQGGETLLSRTTTRAAAQWHWHFPGSPKQGPAGESHARWDPGVSRSRDLASLPFRADPASFLSRLSACVRLRSLRVTSRMILFRACAQRSTAAGHM